MGAAPVQQFPLPILKLWNDRDTRWRRAAKSKNGPARWTKSKPFVRLWMHRAAEKLKLPHESYFLACRIMTRLDSDADQISQWLPLWSHCLDEEDKQLVLGCVSLHLAAKFTCVGNHYPFLETWFRRVLKFIPSMFDRTQFNWLERQVLKQMDFNLAVVTLHDYLTLILTVCDFDAEERRLLWFLAILTVCAPITTPSNRTLSMQNQVQVLMYLFSKLHTLKGHFTRVVWKPELGLNGNTSTHYVEALEAWRDVLREKPWQEKVAWCVNWLGSPKHLAKWTRQINRHLETEQGQLFFQYWTDYIDRFAAFYRRFYQIILS